MKWLILIPVIVVASIMAIHFYLQPNDFSGCDQKPTDQTGCRPADAVVVVSGGNTALRTEAGIKLFNDGWARALVLSGAAMDKSGPSNAASMKQQAVQAGVPESVIFIDEEAVNTQQNAENSHSIFKQNNFNDVILVTSGYHQRRASLEFNARANDVTVRNHPVANDSDWGSFWWATPRGWWLAGGELVKIVAFHLGATS